MYEKLFEDIRKKAKLHGIKIKINKNSSTIYIDDEKTRVAGYFDSEEKVLAVAAKMDTKDWVSTFIHESCHMDQWIENTFMWDKLSHGYALFFDWLTNKKIVKREVLEECVQDIIRLEKDCEIRSVAKIKKYGIDIDVKRYIKIANSYLYAYLYFLEVKKWIPKIYSFEEVWQTAPSRFPKEHKKIPIKLYRQFKKAEFYAEILYPNKPGNT